MCFGYPRLISVHGDNRLYKIRKAAAGYRLKFFSISSTVPSVFIALDGMLEASIASGLSEFHRETDF